MILLATSFLAGVLTVLAPCIFAFLPVILARSTSRLRSSALVIAGLAISVFAFSILLKSTTLLISVPASVWSIISGLIVLAFGITLVFPGLWERLATWLNVGLWSQKGLAKSSEHKSWWGDLLVGASLGPVFSACSPTYALIVAVILPVEPVRGLAYLLAYILGLVLVLSLVAVFGRRITQYFGWGLNPGSKFHKIFGVVLIVVGLLIITGLDKQLLSLLVEAGLYDWQIDLETHLVQ